MPSVNPIIAKQTLQSSKGRILKRPDCRVYTGASIHGVSPKFRGDGSFALTFKELDPETGEAYTKDKVDMPSHTFSLSDEDADKLIEALQGHKAWAAEERKKNGWPA